MKIIKVYVELLAMKIQVVIIMNYLMIKHVVFRVAVPYKKKSLRK